MLKMLLGNKISIAGEIKVVLSNNNRIVPTSLLWRLVYMVKIWGQSVQWNTEIPGLLMLEMLLKAL